MKPTLWIRNPLWDSFWILSGFWLPILFLLLPLTEARPVVLLFTLCFWIAHRLSSLYLALCVKEYAKVISAHKKYFFGLPLSLFFGLMSYLFLPQSILPLSPLNRFVLLGLIDYFFSLYHFAVQHYGVLSVYRSKLTHGQRDPELLKYDWWLCITVSGICSLLIDILYGEFNQIQVLNLEPVSDPGVLAIKGGLSLLVVIAGLSLIRLYIQKQQGLARILYLSSLCLMSLVSFYVDPLLYFAMVQIQHWFVSLGLTSHMAGNSHISKTESLSLWYRGWNWFNQRFWGPLGVLIVFSLICTPILEADYYILQGFKPDTVTVPAFLVSFTNINWIYFFGGLAFLSSFTHYIYDRGVFRFSDPLVRQSALPLLQGKGSATHTLLR